jgi:hypothetical protein
MRTETIHGWTRKVLGAACGLALAGVAAAAAVDAANQPATAPPAPSTTQTASLGAAPAETPRSGKAAGLIAVLPGGAEPPESATLLADPELAAAFSTSAEGLFEETLPDGSVRVRLEGRFQSVLVATVTPSGRVTASHRPLPGPAFFVEPHREPAACRPAPSGKEVGHAQN